MSGLSHCPHSIEVAHQGDAAGDAIKTHWQCVRQAIGAGDATRVSTMGRWCNGSTAVSKTADGGSSPPRPAMDERPGRSSRQNETSKIKRYEDIRLLCGRGRTAVPLDKRRRTSKHDDMGVESVWSHHLAGAAGEVRE